MTNSNQTGPVVKTAATFVGRKWESAELRSALEDAVAGRGRLVLVAGEPGMGKTRLADELAGEATSLGAQVAWGRCWESKDAPAYWPWIQILRSSIRGREPVAIESYMGSGASAILNLIPEFRAAGFANAGPTEAGSDASVPSAGNQVPEMERFRLFDSVTNFLRNFALDTPLVIILDDVHAADVDSLLLLRFLARDLRSARIMLIATYRESEVRLESRRTELVNDIHREGDRILLRGLTEPDTAEFVARTARARPDPKTVAALHAATEGNPFFLREIISLLISEGRLDSRLLHSIASFEIPLGVRSAIRRHVHLVSEAARATLALASTIGREFDLKMLRELSPLADQELYAALDEAVASGLLGTVGRPVTRYRYSHALVCETLDAELPAIDRQRLHLKIAEALERLTPAGEKPNFAKVAHHYVRALPSGSVQKALEYSRCGAEQAIAVHAYEEAVRLYRTMLDVLPLQ